MWGAFVFFTVAAYVSSASSLDFPKLPEPSCTKTSSPCIPNACSTKSCSLFKDVKCIPDNCGCKARFFMWMPLEKVYHEVTKACEADTKIKAIKKAVLDTQYDELSDAQVAVTPVVAIKLFKELNVLTSEALTNIARHLRTIAESNPTEENLQRYRKAIDGLQALQRSRRVAYAADTDVEKRFWLPALAGTLLKKDEGFDVPSASDLGQFDEDQNIVSDELEGRGILGAVVKGISTGIKVAKGISKLFQDADTTGKDDQEDEDFEARKLLPVGPFSPRNPFLKDEDSQMVLVMDEDTGEIFQARALPKISPKTKAAIKTGVKNFCKGFRDGLCSDQESGDEDFEARKILPIKLVKQDLEIAQDLISPDGQFADIISADPDARAKKVSTAEKCGRFLGKLTKVALTAAIAAGCAAG